MIKKISKLKDFGIFHDFSWGTGLPEFERFNLIYGWNRSGKTTLSRVFESCEKKLAYDEDKFKQYPKNGAFEIVTKDNKTVKSTDILTNTLQIKVFNQDFIDHNVSFEPSTSCNPIIYISEEDIESKKRLEQLKKNRVELNNTFENSRKTSTTKEAEKKAFLTGLGREVANMLFDKTYNRTKAENKINSVGVDNFSDKVLSDEEQDKYQAISKSEQGIVQDPFNQFSFSFLFETDVINNFEDFFELIKKTLEKKVVSETLARLKDDQNLNNWVKQGFDLHKRKEEKEKCLFCQKTLDSDFLNSLSKHFSMDYENLQKTIIELKSELLKLKRNDVLVKNELLYPDLKEDYTKKAINLNEIIKKTNNWINTAITKLDEKYDNPLIVVANPDKPEDFFALYNGSIDDLNKIILNHNTKIENHPTEVKNAKEKLELHSIASAISAQNYKKIESDLKKAVTKEKKALATKTKNDEDISVLEKKNSNIGKAIEEINKHLKEFFGREEIQLDLDEHQKGYIIKRYGQAAYNLSEGEKTAIAFSYFIVKVGSEDFKVENGIIFIDDPISSFDSNFIYHCFTLIRHQFRGVGQLFISTHNFHFFNLAKKWFMNKNKSVSDDNKILKAGNKTEKLLPCTFFMVENFCDSGLRQARVVELDKTLRKYTSEYHFLFDTLKKVLEGTDQRYSDLYTVGNMARRFFDIFVDFKIPKDCDQKSKLDSLLERINEKEEKVSAVEAGKAYELFNASSHNSEPTSTIEHLDKSESQNAIKVLLRIVKESDPQHYDILERECSV